MTLNDIVGGSRIIAVTDLQLGDTGKGKITELLAYYFDAVVRGAGGANAGHTVMINGREVVYHQLPVGIVHDRRGVISVLGNGMVVDPWALCEELDDHANVGGTSNNLVIGRYAGLVLPWHLTIDKRNHQSQKNGGIGSTGRGIGPAYADKIDRRGPTIGDMLDRDVLVGKLNNLRNLYTEEFVEGSIDDLVDRIKPVAERLKPFIRDSNSEVQRFIREGKRILQEGANGILLSINHGVVPYCTSSDCSVAGTSSGAGIPTRMIDLVLGIVKFPFMTRVGGGPFVSEYGGSESEKYCAETDSEGKTLNIKTAELEKFRIPYTEKGESVSYDHSHPKIIGMINSEDPFEQGIGIRLAAGEYGASTGRPRRVGATDLIALRYAVDIESPVSIVLTKPDCMAGAEDFATCTGYELNGEINRDFRRDEKYLRTARPVLRSYPGYDSIRGVDKISDLPSGLKIAIEDLEKATDTKVVLVSTGPERDQYAT